MYIPFVSIRSVLYLYIFSLETIQNQFIRFILYNCDVPRQPHSQYIQLLIQLNMTSLAERIKLININFLYEIVNGLLNYSELLNCLNFNVSHCRIGPVNMFYIPISKNKLCTWFVFK